MTIKEGWPRPGTTQRGAQMSRSRKTRSSFAPATRGSERAPGEDPIARQPGTAAAPEVMFTSAAQPGGAGSQERANAAPAQPTCVEPPPSPTARP
eukprot:271138-Pyramimonas_sp.AAC.1